ncbi:MAG: hypothetical protein ACTSRG_14850 [Candidatus Helarchaeota archaeon]
MCPAPNYLIDKTIVEELKTFYVNKLSKFRWFLVILLSVLPLIILIQALNALVFIVIVIYIVELIVSPIIWKKAGKFFLDKLILEQLKIWKKGEELNPIVKMINSFMGLDIVQKNYFYLEAAVPDIDLNSLWEIFKKRILNVTSACLGVAFGIATILKFIPLISHSTEITSIFGTIVIETGSISAILFTTIMATAISPLLIFWLIPIIWTTQDANIKYVTVKQRNFDLGEKISGSFLRYLLGFAGLSLAFGFILDTPQFLVDARGNSLMKYTIAGIFLMFYVLLIIGIAFLTGMIYLSKYHEEIVNNFRSDLAQIININNTILRDLSESEKILFYSK